MRFLDFLKNEDTIDEAVSKWQKTRKQTSGHKAKKATRKKVSTKQKQSSKELKRLSGISAKREVKDFFSKQMFKKKFTDLDPSQKEKVNEKMKTNLAMQKVVKLTNQKTQERIKKQKEKETKDLEKKEKAKEKTKTDKEETKAKRKKDVEKKEKEKFEKKIGGE